MDHCEKVKRKQNPRERANVLSLITFSYTGGLFKKSIKRDLEENDIYEVIKPCKSKKNGDRFETMFKQEKKRKNPSLTHLMWRCFGLNYAILGIIHLFAKLIPSIYEPEAVGKLVRYFSPNQTAITFNDAVYYAIIMIGLKFFHAFYFQNYMIYLQQLSIRIRSSLCSLVYRKALRLTPTALGEVSLGNIITVITKDVLVFEHSIQLFNDLWIETVKLFVVTYLIYNKIGAIGFAGIGVLLSVIPAQVMVTKMIKNLRLSLCQKTDERLQATQETLSTIKIIKMYTWEKFFAQEVEDKRRKEMKFLMKSVYLNSINFIVGQFTSKIGFYVLIMTYIYVHENVNSEVIFYVMKCFHDLHHSIGILIPFGLGRGAELLASASRVNKIIKSEEIQKEVNQQPGEKRLNIVKLCNVSVKIKEKEILKDVSLELKNGLTVITGPLGSGKSTLLKVMLKDYQISEGKIISDASFSYCSQDPWLFPSSIRQNILFGQKYNAKRYSDVLEICALKYDLKLLENGDQTIVADRGLNLSGGQQARVNLARAIYKKSDVYLLDDPLNALDPSVQDHIYQKCILEFLKKEKVVLVSHNEKYIDNAEDLVLMSHGKVKLEGRPAEIPKDIIDTVGLEELDATKLMVAEMNRINTQKDTDWEKDITKVVEKSENQAGNIYSEVKKEGKVDFSVYKKYFSFGGGFLVFAVIVSLFVGTEFAGSYSSKVLTNWINIQENITATTTEDPQTKIELQEEADEKSQWYLTMYSSMIISSVVIDLIKQFFFVNFARKASVNLHNAMIERLCGAMMTFYDNYFIGNILNRFSQDLTIVDEHLPMTINFFVMTLLASGGIVILVASVNWQFLIPASILVITMFFLRVLYMPTARSLKRLEASTRSPLIGHLNASMEGVATIRAFKAEKILIEEFDRHQDLYTSAHYMTFCVRRAFAFFMDVLSAVFITVIVAKFLLFDTGEASGDVGLAITKAASLAHIIQFVLMQWADLENNMTSVERVLEYTEVPQERYEGDKIENWPSKGAVTYDKVSLAYKDENVLKNISFAVTEKQKIGIVGRTGAGKSSIISTLFRLYNFEGTIHIDGIDINSLNLEFLRDSISIIPQEPLLFQGSIRQNIDPLNRFSDEEIWKTLDKVYIKSLVPTLSLSISDHGSNFSTGQRQLICLARAIIRKNKLVVLDEATSNMDPETEDLVQKVIKEQFYGSTVFVIAHRLESVLNCDKVLVMEKGQIIEFDNPRTLMTNKDSAFAKMLVVNNEFTHL